MKGVEADCGVHGRRGTVEMVPGGGRGPAPFFRVDKKTQKRTWFSDASFEIVGGLCLETGAYWRHNLSAKGMKRTIRNRNGGAGNRFSVNVLKLLGMVMAAYVMLVIRRDRPSREGETVLMRGGSSYYAVQWVINCGGG